MKLGLFFVALTALAQTPELSGVWVVSQGLDITSQVPYQPAFLKLWNDRKADLKKQDPATYCLPNGVVRLTNLPYKIVQTPALVVVLSEGNTHSYRRVFLDGRKHNLDLDPNNWNGDSIGHWEGSALIVDSIGFNDKTWLDGTGKPHSEALHVTERYTRPAKNRLEIQYTLEDPKALTKPFTFTRTLVPANREIKEQFCTDTNRLAAK